MRVIVVGAGLAGLTAARRLTDAGVEVTVVEARDEAGGRTRGIEVAPGAWIDAGAAYLGDRHTQLHALLAEHGLKTMSTGMDGDSRFELGGDPRSRSGRFPPLSAVALGELFDALAELTAVVRVDAPWLTPDAARLDNTTVQDWVDENLSHPDSRLFFPLFLGEMMAADPADISVLHMGFYLTSGGGVRYLNAFDGGAQQDRVDGGAQQLSQRMAADLDVRYGQPVLAVDAEQGVVRTATDTHHGDAVVLAIPPRLADGIDISPLPPVRRSTDRTAPGCAVKAQLVYPAPVWRDHGLSGWSVNATGPLLSTVDDTPADGSVGVLTGFVTGAEAHRFGALPADEQRAAAVAQAARLFPFLPEPLACHITDWVTEPYSRGCYAALFGPGDWMHLGPHLTEPHHRIHWAGTETSTEFFGLMEGAIRSGYRVADEILNHQKGSPR